MKKITLISTATLLATTVIVPLYAGNTASAIAIAKTPVASNKQLPIANPVGLKDTFTLQNPVQVFTPPTVASSTAGVTVYSTSNATVTATNASSIKVKVTVATRAGKKEYRITYDKLSKISVTKNQVLKKGQPIARSLYTKVSSYCPPNWYCIGATQYQALPIALTVSEVAPSGKQTPISVLKWLATGDSIIN